MEASGQEGILRDKSDRIFPNWSLESTCCLVSFAPSPLAFSSLLKGDLPIKILTGALVLMAAGGAYAGELDGKTYCRTVYTDGSFSQPPGEREHCVSFDEDQMSDDMETFFGNPPTHLNYVLVGGKILVVEEGNLTSNYRVEKNLKTLIYGSDVTMKLKK